MSAYLFSKQAEKDLIEIYRYGFINYGEEKANLYAESLKEKCVFIAEIPLLNTERFEFDPPVRIHHHQKHLIIYVITKSDVLIVRILHERMNVKQHLI